MLKLQGNKINPRKNSLGPIGLKKIPERSRHATRCIFCKQSSVNSKSIEHIIPESLGNSTHFLSPGIVCDSCNNYFGTKIERPLLETPYFKNLRGRQSLPNKRRRVPLLDGLLLGLNREINILFGSENRVAIKARHEADDEDIRKHICSKKKGRFIIPAMFPPIDQVLISKFISKIALEALTYRLCAHEGWESQVIDHTGLDPIRKYARYGQGVRYWPIHQRRIYDENFTFSNSEQVLHEFDCLYTREHELYALVCIFGEEYAVNMGGPELNGYMKWLEENSNASYLYMGKNSQV